MTSKRPPQRKGKAAVPKPPRGSGLNPSGFPLANQLYLPAEQPHMPAFNFDPYAPRDADTQDQPLFNNAGPSYSPSNNLGFYSGADAQNQPFDGPSYSGASQQGQSYDGPSYLGGDSGEPDTQSQGPPFYDDDTQDRHPAFDDDAGPPYDFGSDFDFDTSGFDGGTGPPGPSGHGQTNLDDVNAARPTPAWVDQAPDQGIGLVDRGGGLVPSNWNTALIRRGEIPRSEIVHTGGPARTTKKRASRRSMPGTPYIIPQPLSVTQRNETRTEPPQVIPAPPPTTSHVSPKIITLSQDSIADAVNKGKQLIIREMFSRNALGLTRRQRQSLVERAINESIPACHEPNVAFTNFITKLHLRKVANAFSSTRGKMISFARDGVFVAFELFPPIQNPQVADTFRVARNGLVTVHAKFENPFVMALTIRFIWSGGRQLFLGDAPLKALKHVVALSGAATHCALEEQGRVKIDVISFGETSHGPKFKEILAAFKSLSPEEKASLKIFLQYILDVGPSQAREGEDSLASSPESSDWL
ncbi:hypothetical protein DEU56DRAFT_958638 [Suillus clintonianus]|uniref:uncharacterized protein n=1 Tax=Suillus clintonianus TaxID=1904413 RepID=UPI001B86245F|nr:uncharacterized protein DEU56DRAFT_958638 [Suillus clintonianus]KAG2127480.1 hypothetical protein DEU56DRAFT_958638 [Suillus clintonianus]